MSKTFKPRHVLWILIRHFHWWQAFKFCVGHYLLRESFTVEQGEKTEVSLGEKEQL